MGSVESQPSQRSTESFSSLRASGPDDPVPIHQFRARSAMIHNSWTSFEAPYQHWASPGLQISNLPISLQSDFPSSKFCFVLFCSFFQLYCLFPRGRHTPLELATVCAVPQTLSSNICNQLPQIHQECFHVMSCHSSHVPLLLRYFSHCCLLYLFFQMFCKLILTKAPAKHLSYEL